MKFTIDERIEIIKWYFNGISLTGIVELFITKCGSEDRTPSTSGIRYTVQLFEKNGCFQNYCRQCVQKSTQISDEAELNEIMVCAAAELELSIRDIAVELELTKSTVFRILKKNGYSTTSVKVESTSDTLEKLLEARKQIIRWYSQKKSLSEMILLFRDNFNIVKQVKEEIINSIKLFEMYGCIRDCGKCQENIYEPQRNLDCQDIEKIILKQSQINTEDESQIAESRHFTNKKVKLASSIEPGETFIKSVIPSDE